MKRSFIPSIYILTLLLSLSLQAQTIPPKREVRAVWLTTIGGLDWPKQKANSAQGIERQKKELTQILDQLAAANFNTVFLQTRIRSTVIYPSRLEPWDDCLTGHLDRHPGYDPLQFAINECHKRHLELHAWVVAFPGHNFAKAKALGRKAMQQRLPKLCIKTQDNSMLNPGEPATADYLASICEEIASNYDVDGIHLDYIRYPEKEVRFNDAATFRKYGKGQQQSAWRRANVDHCVETIHQKVESLKPWIRMSCSPVGKYDDLSRYSSRGWNALHTVHQDAQGWLARGWMDMLVPMMYFQGDHFYPFVCDWVEHASGRIVVPGLGVYFLADEKRKWPFEVIERESNLTRTLGSQGQAYFRSRFVTENTQGLYDYLKKKFYPYPAFTPALSWESEPPQAPLNASIKHTDTTDSLCWQPVAGDHITYNVYRSYTFPVNTESIENLLERGLSKPSLSIGKVVVTPFSPYYAITAMDRYGNESRPLAFTYRTTEPATPVRQTICSGLLAISNDTLLLPRRNREELIYVTDATERHLLTTPYTEKMPLSQFPNGLYILRSLQEKGRDHFLGRILIRQ